MTHGDMFWAGELDDLLALESGLTMWEVDFVESVEAVRKGGRTPSEKQLATVHEIWDRRCG